MNQSRLDSILESLTNILVGFIIAYLSAAFIYWWMGLPVSAGQNFKITIFFTVISFIRSYSIRRLFNGRSIYSAIKSRFL